MLQYKIRSMAIFGGATIRSSIRSVPLLNKIFENVFLLLAYILLSVRLFFFAEYPIQYVYYTVLRLFVSFSFLQFFLFSRYPPIIRTKTIYICDFFYIKIVNLRNLYELHLFFFLKNYILNILFLTIVISL